MNCTRAAPKIYLAVLGFLFWGAAAALLFLGIWMFHTYQCFSELTTINLTLIPAGILIVTGVLLFLLGSYGFIAACRGDKCRLRVFFSLLVIVLTAEMTAAVIGFVFKTEIVKAVNHGLKDAIDKYSATPSMFKDQIDYLQKELKCCGMNNASDWTTATAWCVKNIGYVPQSCCDVSKIISCNTTISSTDIYIEGCGLLLNDKFQTNLIYASSVALSFAGIQIIGMISTCILVCYIGDVPYKKLGGPNSGLRV